MLKQFFLITALFFPAFSFGAEEPTVSLDITIQAYQRASCVHSVVYTQKTYFVQIPTSWASLEDTTNQKLDYLIRKALQRERLKQCMKVKRGEQETLYISIFRAAALKSIASMIEPTEEAPDLNENIIRAYNELKRLEKERDKKWDENHRIILDDKLPNDGSKVSL